jgi:hypothetical protein
MKCFLGFVFLLILKQKTNRKHQTNKEEKSEVLHFGVFVWKWSNTRTQTNTQKGRKTKNGEECKAEKQSKKKRRRNFFFLSFLPSDALKTKSPFQKTVVEFVPIVQAARHFSSLFLYLFELVSMSNNKKKMHTARAV